MFYYRLLKKLKEKDEKQLDLERREQGFSIYLNGANVDLQVSGHHKSRKTKTAGGIFKIIGGFMFGVIYVMDSFILRFLNFSVFIYLTYPSNLSTSSSPVFGKIIF